MLENIGEGEQEESRPADETQTPETHLSSRGEEAQGWASS